MNRDDIQDLHRYLDFAWDRLVEAGRCAGADAFTRQIPGSGWPALANCLSHIVFGYDRWLGIMNARPLSGAADGIATFDAADAARSEMRAEADALLGSLGDGDLQQVRPFEIDGTRVPYSYAELLVHLALHERGHHGDANTLLYQQGIDVPMLEYRFHLGRQPLVG